MTDSESAASGATAGHVWLVGAGPGDPGLFTLAGARAMASADVVLYDALAALELLALAREDALLIDVGKRAGDHPVPQREIEGLIIQHAREGKSVVRLKGGDPFLFGRGGEEMLACRRAGVSVSVIPGVTSALAVPAYAGIPVTHRGLSADLHIITSAEGPDGTGADWPAAAKAGTLVILMGLGTLARDMQMLIDLGKPPATPAACISAGTRPEQRAVAGTIATLAALVKEAGLASPAITVVGDVAALHEDLSWRAPGRLAGKTVVVTRASHQASALSRRLEATGARVLEVPVISIDLHAESGSDLCDAVRDSYDWWVFTSANAVEATWQALDAAELDSRHLAGARIAAISAGTADALRARGIRPDFVPRRGNSDELGRTLPLGTGETVVLPRSSLADGALPETLAARGAKVTAVSAYATTPRSVHPVTAQLVAASDAILFTSASTADELSAALGENRLSGRTKLISMGPQTSAAVRRSFGRVDGEAEAQSLDALVEALHLALA